MGQNKTVQGRVSPEILKRLQAAAAESKRSIAREIAFRLERDLAAHGVSE